MANPIHYSELFNQDVDAKLASLKAQVDSIDTSFQDLSKTITGMSGRINVSIKGNAAVLKEMDNSLDKVNVTSKGAAETLTQFGKALDATTKQSANLKTQQSALDQIFDTSAASVDELKSRIKTLTTEYNSLGRATDSDKTKSAALSAEVRKLKIEQDGLTTSLNKTKGALQAAEGSYTSMNARLNQLRKELKEMPNAINQQTGAWNKTNPAVQTYLTKIQHLDTSIKKMDATLGNHQRNVGNYSSALKGVGGQLTSLVAGYVSVYAALAITQKIVKSNAEISDSLADVRRTAQLTADEADRLADSLKKINTGTSLKGLLAISVIGGQLGIAKDQLAGFTQVIDRLAVVLSNEIPGGAEVVATALGKINGVFKVQQKEGTNVQESLSKTGSAILRLGQVGLATGEYLQDFTLRVAGTAQVAGISLPTILAYSAVLEETGSSAEVAGTSFNKLVSSLASRRKDFFAIAKIADATLTLKDFTDLINKDANAALQLFFKGLNKGGVNLTEFTDLLDTLKIKTGPGKNAIIALAQNQELLNKRINESSIAYKDGSLEAEQFAIKNDNLASSIAKLGNAFTNITTDPNSGFGKFLKMASDGITGLIKELDALMSSKSLKEFIRVFAQGYEKNQEVMDPTSRIADAVKSFQGQSKPEQRRILGQQTTEKNLAQGIFQANKTSENRAYYHEQITLLVAYQKAYLEVVKVKEVDLTTTEEQKKAAEDLAKKQKDEKNALELLRANIERITLSLKLQALAAIKANKAFKPDPETIKSLEELIEKLRYAETLGRGKDITEKGLTKAFTGTQENEIGQKSFTQDQTFGAPAIFRASIEGATADAPLLAWENLLERFAEAEKAGQTELTKIYHEEIQNRLKDAEKAKEIMHNTIAILRQNNEVIGNLFGQEFGNLFDNLTTNLENLLDKSGNSFIDWANTAKAAVGVYSGETDHPIPWQTDHLKGWRTVVSNAIEL